MWLLLFVYLQGGVDGEVRAEHWWFRELMQCNSSLDSLGESAVRNIDTRVLVLGCWPVGPGRAQIIELGDVP